MRRTSLLLLALLPLAVPALAAAVPDTIPQVRATTLAGESVTLPDGGRVAVLVLGFSQGASAQVTDWGKHLAATYHDRPAVRFYELSMLGGVPRFLRGYVVGRIRSSLPERAWPHFLPVTDNDAAWRKAVAYADPDEAYVVVIDPQGHIRWRAHGPASDAQWNEAVRQVGLPASPAPAALPGPAAPAATAPGSESLPPASGTPAAPKAPQS